MYEVENHRHYSVTEASNDWHLGLAPRFPETMWRDFRGDSEQQCSSQSLLMWIACFCLEHIPRGPETLWWCVVVVGLTLFSSPALLISAFL